MKKQRALAVVAAGAMLVLGSQLGLAAAAHADGLESLGFDGPWNGGTTETLPQGWSGGHSLQVTGLAPGDPDEANVLVMWSSGTPALDGTDVPDLPAGFTASPTDGACTPAAQAATGSGTAAYICDLGAGGQSDYAAFDEHIGNDTPDGSLFTVSATIVPHDDTTLAEVQADQRAGAAFTSETSTTAVESRARAAQDAVTTHLTDLAAGGTATETVGVHAVDHGTVTVLTSSGVPGQVWTDPARTWMPGVQDVFLPDGISATAITADGGADCTLVPAEYQHTLNNYSANDVTLARCEVTPDTTSITLTFTADATVPATPVELTAGYHVFDNTLDPQTTASGVFTVQPAA